MRWTMVALAVAGGLAWAGLGRAGEPRTLDERVADLERRVAVLEGARAAGASTNPPPPRGAERAAAEAARRALERAYEGRVALQSKLTDHMTPEHVAELRALESRIDAGTFGALPRPSLLVMRIENAYLRCMLTAAQRQRLPRDAESSLFALQRALRDGLWLDAVGALDRMEAALPRRGG